MTNVQGLARLATAAALRLRVQQKRGLYESICPYDLALDVGIEVRFETIPSLEGIYYPGPTPLILLNSLRPSGRRAYNCAHEIGHHIFGHGTRIDVLRDRASKGFDPIEYVADRFAAAVLMPKVAILRAFAARNWAAETCTPTEMLAMSRYFGVGYSTLIGYLEGTLGALPQARAGELRRCSPKSLRRALLGADKTDCGVTVVDEHWGSRSVDVEVGDLVVLPTGRRLQGGCIASGLCRGLTVARAVRPGSGSINSDSSSIAVRVCRREYRGLADYRFDEDPDDEES